MSTITISFKLDADSLLESLNNAAESFEMKVKDGVTAEQLAKALSADIQSDLLDRGISLFFYDGINADVYQEFLEYIEEV